ncbi:uncharacterized protein LOC112349265 isoform X1 [Selaginella moellendorffii]|uniref:uncharacterized protein LOC112349265 isoform X1 n=1 Tax=Selaginella moellendorffii TaxID=88036 RepID=UPI000D1CAA81|nr:uncharacterized protein LOC112349265 isoform X1 [Selaginella moellendorffii]|eukprot:XP_024539138.1 uncharacterized protein LOC112349265 isoform X1 [Selaginella moellendorffii]
MLGIVRLETCLGCCLLLVALINMLHPSCCARILESRGKAITGFKTKREQKTDEIPCADSPPKGEGSLPKVARFSMSTSARTPSPPSHDEVVALDSNDRQLEQFKAKMPRGASSSIHLDQQKHHHHHHHPHKNHKALNANAAPPVAPPIHEVDAKASTSGRQEDHGGDNDDDSVGSEEMTFHADYAKVRTHPPHSH